jgi:hypothetical protein
MLGMLFRHVPWLCGRAWIELPDMSGDAFVVKINLNQFVTRMQLHLFAHTVMRYRVKMLIVDQVIIDVDAGIFDVGVLVSVLG